MTDDELERRLREAFEAKATSITPDMLDVDRERELAAELAGPGHGSRRWMAGGLSAAAAVAAAVGIGFVVSNQRPPTREPVVAASSHTTRPTSSGAPATPYRHPAYSPTTSQAAPPQTTPPPTSTTTQQVQPPPVSTTSEPTVSHHSSTPSVTTSTTAPTSTGGNYYFHGDLRKAAGVAFLPLPATPPTTVTDETSRTVRLGTDDCAAILTYWETAMPDNGWKRAPSAGADMWFSPTGDAWAFTDKSSGACTIQVSTSP